MNIAIAKKRILVILLLVSAFIVYNYIYKSHRNIESETPSFVIESSKLIKEFTSSIEISSNKYLDKTIVITGFVSTVEKGNLQIENTISCYFSDTILKTHLLNKRITIKGRCIGYDELLEEIKMDQCVIITN